MSNASTASLMSNGWIMLLWDMIDTSFEFGMNLLDSIIPMESEDDALERFALETWAEEKRNILRLIRDRIFEEFPDASCDDIARQFGLSTYSVRAISKNRRGKAVMGWLYE